MAEPVRVAVEGRALELSNLDKVLYPETGFTKGEVIDYYTRVAPVLLPHLADRPLTRVRYPNGVSAFGFFEKNLPPATPDWVRRTRLPAPGSRLDSEVIYPSGSAASGAAQRPRAVVDYVVVDSLASLVWLANLAALELHTPQWRVGARGPDLMVIDLDPGPPAGIEECAGVAALLRARLGADGLRGYPKTSGRKGMQLCCPISGEQTAEQVTRYVRRVAEELEHQLPGVVVSRMGRHLRPGKVFIDWSQNNAAKTTVAPYSLRAQPTPTVSAPLTWDEVLAGGLEPEALTAAVVLDRVAKHGDLLAPLCVPGPPVPTW